MESIFTFADDVISNNKNKTSEKKRVNFVNKIEIIQVESY
jgi:hypothetical protein